MGGKTKGAVTKKANPRLAQFFGPERSQAKGKLTKRWRIKQASVTFMVSLVGKLTNSWANSVHDILKTTAKPRFS
jgi:hypothetical protein